MIEKKAPHVLDTQKGKKAFLKALNERFKFTKHGMIPKSEDSYKPIILSEYVE